MSLRLSHSVTQALGKIVEDEPKEIAIVDILDTHGADQNNHLLIFGRHKFYFLDEQLKEQKKTKSYHYSQIEYITYSIECNKLFKIKLVDKDRPEILIESQNRNHVLKCFQCYWQIDHMFKKRVFDKLKVVQEHFQSKDDQDEQNLKKLPDNLTQPKKSYVMQSCGEYRYHVHSCFELKKGTKSTYYDKNDKNDKYRNQIEVQINQTIPIDYLPQETNQDLRTYCQNLAVSRLQPIDEHIILNSAAYVKKCNLTNDKAMFLCWEVQIRAKFQIEGITYTYEIFATVIRRKYIPPLMETYQDIYVFSKFFHTQDVKIDEATVKFLDENHRQIVDTLHVKSKVQVQVFEAIVKKKAQALLMDEKSMEFYSQQHDIKPEIVYMRAIKYLKSIISNIDKLTTKSDTRILNLMTLLKIQKTDHFDSDSIIKDINQLFYDESGVEEKKRKKDHQEEQERFNWESKVSRYLAYCVDGGLLQSKFTIMDIVNYLKPGLKEEIYVMLSKQLNYLLHARKNNSMFTQQILNQTLNTIATDEAINEYQFNERVMITFIESGRQLRSLMKGQYTISRDAVSKFLKQMIELPTVSNQLKEACCRQVIQIFSEGRRRKESQIQTKSRKNDDDESEDEEELAEFVKLIQPLLECAKNENQQLVQLSIAALINLSSYSQDMKEAFFHDNGLDFILETLKSRQQDILLFLLKLILTLIDKNERLTRKMLSEESLESASVVALLNILLGPQILGTSYSVYVNYYVLLVLRMMMKFSLAVKRTIMLDKYRQSLKAVIQIVEVKDAKSSIEEESVKVQQCVFKFLKQLVKDEIDNKTLVGQLMMDKVFIERFKVRKQDSKVEEKDKLFQDDATELSFFKLLNCLVKSDIESANKIKKIRIELQNYKASHVNNANLSKEIQSIIKSIGEVF